MTVPFESEQTTDAQLRQKAERILASEPPADADVSGEAAGRLLHELRVHQIELELQNEELRRAQYEIEMSRDQYLRLYHHAPVGYLTLDEVGIIQQVNQTFLDMAKVEREEALGRSLTDFLAPSDRAVFLARYGALFRHPEGKRLVTRLLRPGGPALAVRLDTSAMTAGSGAPQIPSHLLLTVSDIQELMETRSQRDQLATAVSGTADGILVTSRDGVILYVNRSLERMTGYTADELNGAKPSLLKSGCHGEAFYKNLWTTISAGRVWNGCVVNRRKDGALYEQKLSITPITDDKGEVERYVAVMNDVTAEAMLSRARWYFTSVTSHEMRTPLTNLNLVQALVRAAREDGAGKEILERAESVLAEACRRLEKIVKSTSLLIDLHAGSQLVKNESYPLQTVLMACVDLQRTNLSLDQRALTVLTDFHRLPAQAMVECDLALFQQALEEVLSNAIKYSPDGSVVWVKGEASRGAARISIIDQGIGMTPEELAVVKTPFLSLESPENHFSGSYAYLAGGIGLGLTLATLIVENFKGELNLASAGRGQGLTVTISVPVSMAGDVS